MCGIHQIRHVCVCVLSHFSHVWLCNPMDCSPPGSSVHGILQARILEWNTCPPQGIFPTQGSNPHLLCFLHWQAGSLSLASPGKASQDTGNRIKVQRTLLGIFFFFFFLPEYTRQNGKEKSISCAFLPNVVKAVSGITISYRDESRGFLII